MNTKSVFSSWICVCDVDVPKSMLLWHDMSSSNQLSLLYVVLYLHRTWISQPKSVSLWGKKFQKWFNEKCQAQSSGKTNRNIRLVLWTLTKNVCHFNCNRMYSTEVSSETFASTFPKSFCQSIGIVLRHLVPFKYL